MARELTNASRRVLILEWGRNDPVTGSLLQTLRELGWPGRSLLMTRRLVALVRGITTGGSSIYYYATATEPPYDMFDRHGIDLRDEIAEAKDELPVAPLSDKLIGPRGHRIMSSARDIGLDWDPLDKFLYQDRFPDGQWLGFYSAPSYESKWNARMWVEEAVTRGATLVTGAKVGRVLINGNAATGVEFTARGEVRRARADSVVLCAGGIGTPVILRASGIREAGYDFFFDPMIAVMGEVPGESFGGREPEFPMATGMLVEDDGYMITDMTVPGPLYALLAAQTGRLNRVTAHSRTLQIMIKIRDGLSGRLTDSGGVNKRLSEDDRDRFRLGVDRAKEILTNSGARNIFSSWPVASHPGATAKIGELVDTSLQTEYANLYVCDCSVIPEAWGRPPTLTLIGLGRRLGKQLTKAS